MVYDTIEDLKKWWNTTTWASRVLYATKVLGMFVDTSNGPKDVRALADVAFEDLDSNIQNELYSHQNPS